MANQPFNLNALHLRALTAEEVLAGLLAVSSDVPAGNTIQFHLHTNISGISLNTSNIARASLATTPEVVAFQKSVAGHRHIACTRAHIRFDGVDHKKVAYETKDGVVAEIVISLPDPQHISALAESVARHFKVTSYPDLVGNISHVVDQQAIQLRERSVADLREELRELAKFMASLTQKEIETRRTLQAEMEADYQQRRQKLDEDHRVRQAALDASKTENDAKLAARETALNDKANELDLRDSKGVRRELLTKMEEVLKAAETQATSAPTQSKRWWVHGFVWGLLLAVGAAAFFSGKSLFTAATFDWHFAGTFSASMITIVTTLVYYMKWNDRWFREHAEAEFAAKRYKADILRASWVAELTMEFSREGKAANGQQTLPPHILEAFTKNLFTDVGRAEASEHPMDQMTGLIKDATEVRVGKTGFKIRKK